MSRKKKNIQTTVAEKKQVLVLIFHQIKMFEQKSKVDEFMISGTS